MNDDLKRLLASRIAGNSELETIEIYHPSFTKNYYLVRNISEGFTGILETGESVFFQYCPMRWERGSAENNLDYDLKITFQDLNEIIAPEIDRIPIDNDISPVAIVRSFIYYRDMTIGPVADGPYRLEIRNITFDSQGSAFSASAKPLNNNGTGEIYTFNRFGLLRGFIT